MNMNLCMGLLIPFLGTTLGSAMVFFMKNSMDKKVEKIRYQIDQLLGEAVQQLYNKKLRKSDATLMDVIQYYNTNELPILNENDVRIQCKGIQIEQPISRESFKRRMERPSQTNIDDIYAIEMGVENFISLSSKDGRDTNDKN